MRMNVLLAGMVVTAILWASSVQAAIITYTNQAAWEAAVSGTILVETFNGQAVRNFASTISESGFNGFSLSGIENGESVGIRTGATSGNIDGSQFLGWQNGDGNAGPTINFNLTSPASAFAFNWFDTDPTDEYELLIDGVSYFNPPFSTGTGGGFFGIVNTSGTFSTATIRNAIGQSPGGFVDPFGVDNVRSVQSEAVPEPATLAMWGLGALGCVIAKYRRRKVAG